MTSTNDGKDVKSNQTSGQKGKSYFIELYKSLEAGLNSDCELRDRTQHLCEAWRRVHRLCQHSAPSTHPHLLSWLQRHTAKTILQTEWQSPDSKNEHTHLENAINAFIQECAAEAATRNGESPAWESQLIQRGNWFKRILANPWGHSVLRKLLDTRGEQPTDEEVLEWLKEERGVMFVTRLRQLAASKCDDLAMSLTSAVMDRVRADAEQVPDADQSEEPKEIPRPEGALPTFMDILKSEAGFTVDVWEILTDIEFVLLHKSDKRSRCIELAKQTPLRNGYQLVERLQSRLETSPREKKLWKNAKEVATLIAQVVIARCMVVPVCAGASRSALYCCTRSLVRLLARPRLPPAAAALAAPAATARHLHTLAAAVHAQSTDDMKPFVCELYVRAITAGMNELERLKLKTEKESEARYAEQVLASWFQQLGTLLQASDRIKCECTLTAFSVHPSPLMYDRIKTAPTLPPVALITEPVRKQEITSEFGSWANDSRSQTNLVKTSETLNLKQSQHQANVLSTAILTEGEGLGLDAELCQDIAVLLSGPRVKTLSWDMDRELLLENCRAYMERTHGGTRALTTELKYLNLDPKAFQHLPEEDDEEGNMFYGIEKGYEHLVEFQEPEEIWQDAVFKQSETESTYSSCAEIETPTERRKKKTRRSAASSEEDSDPLSLVAEAKRNKQKKEWPHSKEKRKYRSRKNLTGDPLETKEHSQEKKNEKSNNKEKKRGRKKKDKSKSSSLSHLVGMKISKVGDTNRIIQTALSVTDSDYDSQGKLSLNSLNSDETEDVLFDGLYSMDELKSPEMNSQDDKIGLLKNNEFSVSNGAVAINKGSTPSKYGNDNKVLTNSNTKIGASKLDPQWDAVRSSSPKIPSVLKPCYKSVTEEVKNSITRLIEFRRQKNADTATSKSKNRYESTVENLKTPIPRQMPCAIIRPDNPFQTQISPKAVVIPEIPKVYINKYQAQKLTEMKNEVNQYMHNNLQAQPELQHVMRNNCSQDSMQSNSEVKAITVAEMVRAQQNKFIRQQYSTNALNNSQVCANQPHVSTSEQKIVNPMDSGPKNFHNFLKDLQQSINAGAAQHTLGNTLKRERGPISRVAPIIPATFRSDTKLYPSAKQISQLKKTDNSLNTFSRLSYMHKNKQSDAKIKHEAHALIDHQTSTTDRATSPLSAELDRIAAEHTKIKMKYLKNKDDVSISRIDKSAPVCKINNNAQVMITKVVKPLQKVSSSYEYPVLSNMLHQTEPVPRNNQVTKDDIQCKTLTLERQTNPASCGSLSESDQNDLMLLLRQKKKLNASYPTVNRQTVNVQEDNYNVKLSRCPMTSAKPNKSISCGATLLVSNKEEQRNTRNEIFSNPLIASSLNKQSQTDFKPTPPKNKNVFNPTHGQVNDLELGLNNAKNIAKSTSETSMELKNVMNAILAQKTPSRGPKALDIALNKTPYPKRFSDSKQEQSVIKSTSAVRSISSETTIPATSTALPLPKHGQQSIIEICAKIKKDPAMNKSISCCKQAVDTDKAKAMLNGPDVHNNSKLATSAQTDLIIPKRQLERTDVIKTNQSGSSKKSLDETQRKLFTSLLPKQDDPFISGIANSDYDLLEELMDDDLRQEIGELSSDDDNYNTPARSIVKSAKTYISDKRVGDINKSHNITALTKNSIDQRHHSFDGKRTVIQMPNFKCNKAMKAQHSSALQTPGLTNDNKAPVDRIRYNKIRNETEVQVANVLHNMATNMVTTPTNINKETYNVKNNGTDNHITSVNPSNVLVTAIPQKTFSNVVLIGSDLVYKPYPTIHAGSHLQQNTYVTLNNTSNMALYQTTEFAAPVMNSFIIGNAITTAMSVTSAPPTIFTVPHSIIHNVSSTQPELNKSTNNTILMDTKLAQKDINNYNIGPGTNSLMQHNFLQNPVLDIDNTLNDNINKNCERKVLSQMQEKHNQKTDSKNLKSLKLSIEDDSIKKDISEGHERLKKKRMSIINRKINHRCSNEPIPLSYASLQPCLDTEPVKQRDRSEAISNQIITPISKSETFNVKIENGDEHITTTISDVTKLVSNENSKENKTDVVQCRRILLRSSNKLKGKAIITNEIPKAPCSKKIKTRQKTATSEFVKVKTLDNDKSEKVVTRSRRRVTKRILSNKKQCEAKDVEKKAFKGNNIHKQKKIITTNLIVTDRQNDFEINGDYKEPIIISAESRLIDIENELLGSVISKNISVDALKFNSVSVDKSAGMIKLNQDVMVIKRQQTILNNDKFVSVKDVDVHDKSRDATKKWVEKESEATLETEFPHTRHMEEISNPADDTTVSEELSISASKLENIAKSVTDNEDNRLTPSILADNLAACLADIKKSQSCFRMTQPFDDVDMSESVTSKLVDRSSTLTDSTACQIRGEGDVIESTRFYQTDNSTISLVSDTNEELEFKEGNCRKTPISEELTKSAFAEESLAPSCLMDDINETEKSNQYNHNASQTSEKQEIIEFITADKISMHLTSKKEQGIKLCSADEAAASLRSENVNVSKSCPDLYTITQSKIKGAPGPNKSDVIIPSFTSGIKQSIDVAPALRNDDVYRSTQSMLSGDSTSLIADNNEIMGSDSDMTSPVISKKEIAIYSPISEQDIIAPTKQENHITASYHDNRPTPIIVPAVDLISSPVSCKKRASDPSYNSAENELMTPKNCINQQQEMPSTDKFTKKNMNKGSTFVDSPNTVKDKAPATSMTALTDKFSPSVKASFSTLQKQLALNNIIQKKEVVQESQSVIINDDQHLSHSDISSEELLHNIVEEPVKCNPESGVTCDVKFIDAPKTLPVTPIDFDKATNKTLLDSLSLTDDDMSQNIPQSYKDSIKIQHLPNTSGDPFKKCVRIKLPNGRVFKATVHGKIHVDFDTLFAQPSMKTLLLSSLTDMKRYTLNVKQISTATSTNPGKILETRIEEVNIAPTKTDNPIETINLLSDDEEDDLYNHFKTEFGTYKIRSANKVSFVKHQKMLDQQCRVLLIDIKTKQEGTCLAELDIPAANLIKETAINTDSISKITLSDTSSNSLESNLNDKIIPGAKDRAFITATNSSSIAEVIEIEDSSNDSVITENNSKPTLQLNDVFKPKDKIHELKDLLLKDLGMEQINKQTVTDNFQKEIEHFEICSSPEIADLNDVAFNKPCRNCFVKVTRCDDLLKKYENMKIMKQKCCIQLVRCDDIIGPQNISSKNTDLNYEMGMDYLDPKGQVLMPTSIDNSTTPLTITNYGRTSPVICAFETIALLQSKDNVKHKLMTICQSTEKDFNRCDSEWLMTKSTLHCQNILQKNMGVNTTSIAYVNLKSANTYKNTLIVPSLMKLMSIYFGNNSIIDKLKPFYVARNNITYNTSQKLKRKIASQNDGVATKIFKSGDKKSTGQDTQNIDITINDSNIKQVNITPTKNSFEAKEAADNDQFEINHVQEIIFEGGQTVNETSNATKVHKERVILQNQVETLEGADTLTFQNDKYTCETDLLVSGSGIMEVDLSNKSEDKIQKQPSKMNINRKYDESQTQSLRYDINNSKIKCHTKDTSIDEIDYYVDTVQSQDNNVNDYLTVEKNKETFKRCDKDNLINCEIGSSISQDYYDTEINSHIKSDSIPYDDKTGRVESDVGFNATASKKMHICRNNATEYCSKTEVKVSKIIEDRLNIVSLETQNDNLFCERNPNHINGTEKSLNHEHNSLKIVDPEVARNYEIQTPVLEINGNAKAQYTNHQATEYSANDFLQTDSTYTLKIQNTLAKLGSLEGDQCKKLEKNIQTTVKYSEIKTGGNCIDTNIAIEVEKISAENNKCTLKKYDTPKNNGQIVSSEISKNYENEKKNTKESNDHTVLQDVILSPTESSPDEEIINIFYVDHPKDEYQTKIKNESGIDDSIIIKNNDYSTNEYHKTEIRNVNQVKSGSSLGEEILTFTKYDNSEEGKQCIDFLKHQCKDTVEVIENYDSEYTILNCITQTDKKINVSKAESQIIAANCDETNEKNIDDITLRDAKQDKQEELIANIHNDSNVNKNIDIIRSDISKDSIPREYEKAINLKDYSEVTLNGIEYEDPIVGTCYVFSIIKSDSSENDSDALNDSTEEVVQILQDLSSAETIEDLHDTDLKVRLPTITYSRNVKNKNYSKFGEKKNRKKLKRKLGMTDIKISEKKYRKGKNIDYPKFTTSSLFETVYCKEYKRLFDYFSSITFSYSRPFHKEHIDVHELLRAWPLNNLNMNENEVDIESNHGLFIDLSNVENPWVITDPIKQTLAEELIAEYDETNYSSIEINETNFNMGFGEGSGRVIKNLKGGDGSKISAATLSDVKQSQPLLLSKFYNDRVNNQNNHKKIQNDQIENLRRYITNIQQRDKVRAYFRKTTVELNLMEEHEKSKASKMHSNDCNAIVDFPYGLNSLDFIQPNPVQAIAQVVQVGQIAVSAAAQNPVTCDPRVTQVSDASPPQCSAENSPLDDSQSAIKTEYTELTTADLSLSLMQDYTQHNHTNSLESQETSEVPVSDENIPIQTEIKSVVKIELMEELPGEKEPNEPTESNGALNNNISNNVEFSYDTNSANASSESDSSIQIIYNSVENQNNAPEPFLQQKHHNGSSEKTDQIAHAMNAAGITTDETITNTGTQALVNILSHKIRQSAVGTAQATSNSYPKTTTINAMALQQALAQILPPPLNQTNVTENNQQCSNTPQLLHIVQGKNASGNQITLVDNSQQSVISTPNTPVLHIVQNKGGVAGTASNSVPTAQPNSFIVDTGIQQGGNQLLHIVNTGSQNNSNAGQLLKKINLLTNLTNVSGSNEQKMVQFVCKSADGKAIQLNAGHQRSMVLRIQPMIEPTNVQSNSSKPAEAQEPSSTSNTANSVPNKETLTSQQEIKSRSVYEENYAKFIQNSSTKQTVPEKSTSLPKFNQAFGKQIFQDSAQKQIELNGNTQHLATMNSNTENAECQSAENTINLEHISQINSPPLLLRKSPVQTSQSQPNLVQQIKQTVAPMNLHSMHGGVIYTRQIPLSIGGGKTINLITVPSTELIDDSAQKQQSDIKFVNQGDIEPSIIKIVPQNQPASNTEVTSEENASIMGASIENAQNPQQPVLTQMRIKLPMLSKTPQMVSGARVVRPSFFQIQRNVIGGANQPVYQQLVLTAAPSIGQQTIRLPQVNNTQTNRPIKVPSENQSSPESQMSSSTLEQLREFDLVLEQVKERSTVQPNTNSSKPFSKLLNPTADTTDGTASVSSTVTEATQQVIYSICNNQPLNVAYVSRKATTTPTTSTYVRSPDSSGIVDSPSSSHVHIPHTVTTDSSPNEAPVQTKSSKVSSKTKSRPKASSNPPNTLKLNPVPPKTSAQKPLEDEQTTQRILYILAEYKEQVENSPDKDKPAPRRRSNPPLNPSGSSKRKKSSSGSRRSGTRDTSPVNGEDSCRTMGSEDSSCGTSQGDCNESCVDSHSPQDSPRKVARKLTFEPETPVTQPRPQPQRNVIVADGQTITVARGTTGKPTTAVLMPTNYILPVSMVKGGQQIAIVTNRGPKLLTVGGGEGGATNALLLQRLIGPAGLKPVLTRPGVRHVRLPTAALHNLQAFNLATATTVQPPDSTASPAPVPAPDLIDTRATSSPWTDREAQELKPERGSSPEGSEPWNLPSSSDPHDYTYEEPARADNMDRTVLDAIPDRYSPDMEAQRIFDKMFDVDSRKSYIVDSPRCGFDIDTSDCDDKAYHQVVHKRDGTSQRQHRLAHVSAAALRHKYAILEHELRLQKSLSEECEDLGVDSPSASELFPEAELLFVASPAHDHTQDHMQHSTTPQPTFSQSCIPQPDIDDQIATDHLLARDMQERELNLGLEDVGIVTVSEDGMQATIALDQEEFARSHPNTTFHSEPTDDAEVQPFTISELKSRHITSTIFHSNRPPGTVLMTTPQATVISQVTGEGTSVQNAVKYSDIENMIDSLPGTHGTNINLSSVLVKDDGLTRFDSILNDSRELHLSNTASAIVHSAGNATQVIRRVCYDNGRRERDVRFLMDEPDALIAGDDAKMIVEDSSRDATLESMAGDVDEDRSSPERHTELFWESNSASERSEGRRPIDFSSDSDKCCKSPSFDETNSTDSSGVGTHTRLDSVIKEARGVERGGSGDGTPVEDAHPPLRTYPPKRMYHAIESQLERSVSGKTRAGERSPDSLEVRRRASGRGVVKRGCHCCNGSPTPSRPKKSRQKKPSLDFNTNN